jgi:hypothetical protein
LDRLSIWGCSQHKNMCLHRHSIRSDRSDAYAYNSDEISSLMDRRYSKYAPIESDRGPQRSTYFTASILHTVQSASKLSSGVARK